ncbi:MAG: hypothetical protein ICV60_00725 [Pyrinomonadaceae bacterium]|nr:hypothetical protein [Pyrinomonadaceae bacterium]
MPNTKLFSFSLLLVIAAFGAQFSVYAQGDKGDIRKIDFQNFTYRPTCPYERRVIRVRGGRYERKRQGDELYFSITQIIYGDLTGDGREEAVVTSYCATGGTGRLSEGYIYTMQRGRLVELVRLEQGDRAFGGISQVDIKGGQLVVERYAPEAPGTGACCPKYIDTQTYRLQGRRLIKVGRAQRRPAPEQ